MFFIKKIPLALSVISLIFFVFFTAPIYADSATIIAKLQSMLNETVSNSTTPGAVLLVSTPELGTITIASGYADLKKKTAMQATNNFRIASMSKVFAAATVLKLVEEGKLKLDDKISTLLPTIDIDKLPNGNKVTVKQLLQMRSGIPNYTDYDGYTTLINNHAASTWTAEECIQLIYNQKPNFEPNTAYEYSNTNYLLLQLIIEKITGKPYAAAFHQYIFNRIPLKDTYVEMQDKKVFGFHGLMTHGYELNEKKPTDVTTLDDGFGLADGGIITTASDMNLFIQALFQTNTILSLDSLKNMVQFVEPDKYGMGVYEEDVNNTLTWTHSGSSSGFSGQYYYIPEKNSRIIILTNIANSEIINNIAEKTAKILATFQNPFIH
jgi:D-alanyl-D-alanine carboxypeptidase